MTKADVVSKIAKSTGVDKTTVANVIEGDMNSVKNTLVAGKKFSRLQSSQFKIAFDNKLTA